MNTVARVAGLCDARIMVSGVWNDDSLQHAASRSYECPSCHWAGTFDPRFPAWCERCDHDVNPSAAPAVRGRKARRRTRRRERRQRSFERLNARSDLRPSLPGRMMVMTVLSVINLLTAAVPVGSILLVWRIHFWWTWPVAALGMAVWLLTRPRLLSNLRQPACDALALTRQTALRLFALLDRCADALRAPRVEKVLLTGDFAASTARLTARRTVYLFLGIPLWTAAPQRTRLALFGHQLAHQTNRDASTGWWASGARRSLAVWIWLFNPTNLFLNEVGPRHRNRPWFGSDPANPRFPRSGQWWGGSYEITASRNAPNTLMMILTRVFSMLLAGPVWLLARGLSQILFRLDPHCHEPAEYFADETAARLGSTESAVTLMDTLALRPLAQQFLRRPTGKAADAVADDATWQRLRDYLASVPEHESLRLLRFEQLEGTSTEEDHPPQFLRRVLLNRRPQLPGELIVDASEWEAIDAELTLVPLMIAVMVWL